VRKRELYCETCQAYVLFEMPPCADSHGAECPELVCTGCGAALLLVPVAVPLSWRPHGAHGLWEAPQRRHVV
jgi:hypothetical protein